jgi:hypothetical protein
MIKPTITIHLQDYDLYSLIIHRVIQNRFRDLLQMQDITLHFRSTPLSQTANGFAIMTLKSQSFNLIKKSLNLWIIVNQILLIYFSFNENNIFIKLSKN